MNTRTGSSGEANASLLFPFFSSSSISANASLLFSKKIPVLSISAVFLLRNNSLGLVVSLWVSGPKTPEIFLKNSD